MEQWKEKLQSVPILLYVPVLHKGYLEFFRRHCAVARELWLIGTDLAAEHSLIHTEIRALNPMLIKRMIGALDIFDEIVILDSGKASEAFASKIITASERVSQEVTKKYFPDAEVLVDTVFLRYDESNVKSLKPVIYDRVSVDPFDLEMMKLAFDESEKSSDWWRHIGAVLVKNRRAVVVAYNQPVPSEHTPYILGNPRDFIEAGELSHLSDVLHAEKAVFVQALRLGLSTNMAWIYTSVFPCPDCAKMIAYSGIKKCFFASGHASLDGQFVLKSQNVELVYVPL